MSLPDNNPLLTNGAFFRLDLLNPSVKYIGGKNKLVCEIDEDTFFDFKRANLKGYTVVCKATVVSDGVDPDFSKEAAAKKRKPQTLSQRAALMCMNQNFWKYLKETTNITTPCSSYDEADAIFKGLINIKSKTELDNDSRAIIAFASLEKDYREWANR